MKRKFQNLLVSIVFLPLIAANNSNGNIFIKPSELNPSWGILGYFSNSSYLTQKPATIEINANKWALDWVIEPRLEKIIRELVICESGGKETAINPKDNDKTPSFGLFQFKPSTLYETGQRYSFFKETEPQEIMNVILDGQTQMDVAVPWIKDNYQDKKFWQKQFPGCSKKFNYWQ